jgi:hypothetical protein
LTLSTKTAWKKGKKIKRVNEGVGLVAGGGLKSFVIFPELAFFAFLASGNRG